MKYDTGHRVLLSVPGLPSMRELPGFGADVDDGCYYFFFTISVRRGYGDLLAASLRDWTHIRTEGQLMRQPIALGESVSFHGLEWRWRRNRLYAEITYRANMETLELLSRAFDFERSVLLPEVE